MPGYGLNQTARSSAIHRLQKESIKQLNQVEVAQLKLGALRPQVCLVTLQSYAPDRSPEQALGCFLEKSVPQRACCIYTMPHQRKNVAQGLFKVGPVAGQEPTCVRLFKNATGPVGIPLFGATKVPGDKPNPSKES